MDSRIVSVGHLVGTVLQSTTLFSATFPCIVDTVEYSLTIDTIIGVPHSIGWMIVIVRDGNTLQIGDINLLDSNSFYDPETDVILFGVTRFPAVPTEISFSDKGKTTTGLRLMQGDRLIFASRSNNGPTAAQVRAAIRFIIHM